MSLEPSFDAAVVAQLRRADRQLRMTDRGDNNSRYSICRTALAAIAPVDSFVVGFFDGDDRFACAYTYDNGRFLPPEVLHVGPHALSRWIRASRKTYTYRSDHGAMLRRTIPFGDHSQISKDAIVVPLVRPGDPDVVGVMNLQTIQPDRYDEQAVRAAEWLAMALMTAIARDDSDLSALGLYALYPELDTSTLRSDADFLVEVSLRIGSIHSAVIDFVELAGIEGTPALKSAAAELAQRCERVQTEIGELMRRHTAEPHAVLPPGTMLTPRELEIAHLIADDGLTNANLAAELHISLKTVKTHVGSILRKLGATQRSEIAWLLTPRS